MGDQLNILATLDEYADAYCAKDRDRLMAIFAEGDAISLIGTGGDELCAGRAAVAAIFERNFREASASRFEWGWRDVAIHGDTGTVAIALAIHLTVDGEAVRVPLRWTVSLARLEAGWKWIHRHASVAASSREEGSAYPAAGR
ncbi:hypothetical protein LNKW23_14940 [Paralimibaculum aggregatum]|uniref:SnoaL-like domain-containing protein n=1 Tax=Paralimibaculum aggregatum TaxID=3036245 RepID=A0ABQ6LPA9_9RHOB|nr:nuclear transport factor 2 family protein [Limibaculum sp. NKW23]GMG82281.1 hypothetical protein LNKW23_14940 [Limibaculum sp. NKW23]